MSVEREEKVRSYLKHLLNDMFYITDNVVGKSLDANLSLLLKPKQKAIDMGFDVEAVGVLIRDPKVKDSVKKLLDSIVQAHTCTLSEFDGVVPAFVMVYPEAKRFFDEDWATKFELSEEFKPGKEVKLIRRLMQRANVGELKVESDLAGSAYVFSFTAQPFFRSDTGRSKIKGVGVKRA